MYAIYRQLHPPTAVEHSLYCHFFSTQEKNLVIVGSSQLSVYRLNSEVESKDINAELKVKKKKLECLGVFSFFGNCASVQSVRLSGANRDALLLSFKDAKVSLVEYDPGTHDLKTSSLHYFEEENLKAGRVQHPFLPIVRVDPENRCAVSLIYGEHLVVLPFRKEGISDDFEKIGTNMQSPILSSYTIDMHQLDEKIDNIVDIQFLHGYFEPTLFILYEPLRTWPGRVAVRQDNKSIVAISLNIQERVHPIIWSLGNLPFDCTQALPVPKPIGGVLVCAVNSMLYLNQSFPPYGVSLNSIAEASTSFPLKMQEGVKLSLDCAQATFLSHDRLVFSLKDGDIYVVTLLVDGMRSVRNLNFDKAASSVITTCMCDCEDGYIFLGSRVGNSLLLKYTQKDSDPVTGIQTQEEPPSKKKRLDTLGDWMASDISKMDEMDELEVYGSEAQTGTQITSYTFEVADSLINIAPCGQMKMGEPAFLSDELSHPDEPDLELVTTSGYAKNGALSVLQRSIRPQVVTTFDAGELVGCYDMWTVKGPPKSDEEIERERNERIEEKRKKREKAEAELEEGEKLDDEEEESVLIDPKNAHDFLILSRDDSSMVLETGQEIMELDHSGFSTQAPTVFAGNIGSKQYILQVSPMGIRLLDGVKQIQHIPIDVGSPITQCSVADPYIVIMSQQGTVMMLTLVEEQDLGPRLSVTKPNLTQKSKVLTYCVYKDVSGMFTTAAVHKDEDTTKAPSTAPAESDNSESLKINVEFDKDVTIDDEDELLYGVSDISVFDNSFKTDEPTQSAESDKEIKPTYWCALARENGVLEIFSIPDFSLCFLVKNFPMGNKVLVDSGHMKDITTKGSEKPSEMPLLKEVLLVGLGNKNRRPFLMAQVDEDLLIYEAFTFHQTMTVNDNNLRLRFKRIAHPLILRQNATKSQKKDEELDGKPTQVKMLRYFSDVAGYSGVFVCGPYPHWIFMTSRGELRLHPMCIDGSVTSFAAFHNINCPRGFLYFNKAGQLRICALPTHLTYDSHWPVRKIPLRCTPSFIAYHPDSKTYGIASNSLETTNRVARLHGDEREIETHEKDDRFLLPQMQKFSVQLFSPVNWEPIPNTKIDMEDWEHITCLTHVLLKSEETVSGLKGYFALGTTVAYGEEVTARGRILILDIIEVVPEPGQPLTKNKIKVIYDQEQKGPVTAMCHVNGYLVSAIGQKIYIWSLKDSDLSGIAFIDTQVYIHCLTNVKGLILAADIMKSISLLRFQEDVRVLSFVSKDARPLEVYSCEYLVDNKQLGFIVSDRDKNILVYNYLPELRESHGGQKLLRRADFNAGSNINTFFRIHCNMNDPSNPGVKPAPHLINRHVTYFATLDGGIGFLLPISEKVYRRLQMLQNFLTSQLSHAAGLNPKAYRAVKHDFKMLVNAQKNILDGDLLWKYINLPVMDRVELAKKIGTSQEQIYEDLIEVNRVTAHF